MIIELTEMWEKGPVLTPNATIGVCSRAEPYHSVDPQC